MFLSLGFRTRRQKTMNWMVAWLLWIHPPLNVFVNIIHLVHVIHCLVAS